MKDLMIDRMNASRDFVRLVEDILEKKTYTVTPSNDPDDYDPQHHLPYDFTITEPGGNVALADVKTYGSSQIDPALIANALFKLSNEAKVMGINKVILVVNVKIPNTSQLIGTINDTDYEILDLGKLQTLIGDDEDQQDLLYEILHEMRDDPPDRLGPNLTPQIFDRVLRSIRKKERDLNPLIAAITECPPGDGKAYEKACQAAIETVFANEFNRWVGQQYVEGGFHKIDLLGHLSPANDFWISLRSDFRTRYVVFEFKNYTEKISQNEIYTTEKYLFLGALRSVAIIVARNGEDGGAAKARFGALREQGKLIIVLTEEQLVDVLQRFEVGEDHHAPLVDIVHNMLSVIGR